MVEDCGRDVGTQIRLRFVAGVFAALDAAFLEQHEVGFLAFVLEVADVHAQRRLDPREAIDITPNSAWRRSGLERRKELAEFRNGAAMRLAGARREACRNAAGRVMRENPTLADKHPASALGVSP
ncbi:MAG TPA: hypothetical protein VI072_17215 [Polyangiaceae bacterium]